MKPPVVDKGEIVIYQREDGKAEISVTLHKESLWLSLNQIAELFGRDKSVVSRHIRKVLTEGELSRDAVVAFFATTAAEGKRIMWSVFSHVVRAVNMNLRLRNWVVGAHELYG